MATALTPRQAVWIGVLATLWGVSFVLVKVAVEELSPAVTVFLRTSIALIFLLVLLPQGPSTAALRALRARPYEAVALAVLQVALPFTLVTVGESQISAGLTAILIATESLFVGLLAPLFDHSERLAPRQLLGLLTGLLGVGVIVGVEAVGSLGEILGAIGVLGASLAYALGSFLAKRRFDDEAAPTVALITVALGAVVMAPAAALTLPSQLPSVGVLAAVVAMGIGGTAIAFLIFYRLLGEIGAGRALLSTYLAPVAALAVAVLALGERFSIDSVIGLVLIIGGVIVASKRSALPIRQ
jgi:drug/metabolite transporter (DMT)-like permease